MKLSVLRMLTWGTILLSILSALWLAAGESGLPRFVDAREGRGWSPLPVEPTRAGPVPSAPASGVAPAR